MDLMASIISGAALARKRQCSKNRFLVKLEPLCRHLCQTPCPAVKSLPQKGWRACRRGLGLCWLLFMPGYGWLAFLQPSQVLWFLPAGLRLAALWVLPAKRWYWLLLAEGLVAVYLDWTSEVSLLDIDFIDRNFFFIQPHLKTFDAERGKCED